MRSSCPGLTRPLLPRSDVLATEVVPNSITTHRSYTWGLDLAGQHGSVNSLEAAGGIGGLLAMCDPDDPCDPADTAGDFVYTYDANGNVGQLLDLTPTSWDAGTVMVARYEYDPYPPYWEIFAQECLDNCSRFP